MAQKVRYGGRRIKFTLREKQGSPARMQGKAAPKSGANRHRSVGYLPTEYVPLQFQVEEPSESPLPVHPPSPFTPLNWPVPPPRVQVFVPASIFPSFDV